MQGSPWYHTVLEHTTAAVLSLLPAPSPSLKQLRACKLVGHRGTHLGTPFIENTLPGFFALANTGVWGVELDIRWTKDLVPVVSHDADCARLFQSSINIADVDYARLHSEVPAIPSLEAVIDAVGNKLHLMIELKDDSYPQPPQQKQILHSLLSRLVPATDYHILALQPDLFKHVSFVPLEAQVIVGIFNVKQVSQYAQALRCGGVAGAYPFFTKKLRALHHELGQCVGTGHINTKRLLFREIAKGTDWIFSNRALSLQTLINTTIKAQTQYPN